MKFPAVLCCILLCSTSEEGFAQNTIGGLLGSDTTLDLGGSPWTVDSAVTVPGGVKLTVEAGVRVEFDPGTGIAVEGGTLVADGSAVAEIVFGRAAGATHEWDGFIFTGTMGPNRLTHFSMEYGDDRGESITVEEARLTIQSGAWPTTEETVIEMDGPAVIIEDSAIPGISGGEVVHGEDLVAPGYLILRRNTFGKASNGGDVIDFTGAEAPGPVLQIIDNVFLGGDDDGLDLDGTDAFVSGNVFLDFRKDPANTRATTSNAVATGLPQTGAANRTRVTLVRNLFVNCDHAVLLKEEAFLTATNNTFVGMGEAVIQFDEVGGTAVQGPGRGAVLEGNIFWDNQQMFRYLLPETELTVNHSVIDAAFTSRGVGNFDADPGFVDAEGGDFSLRAGSPAVGTGPNGLNRGHLVPAGASVSGEPQVVTWSSGASLKVAGPAIVNYRYRLNGAAWSAESPVENRIVLSGLEGVNLVEVIGQDSVGEWQSEADATASESWIVDPSFARVLISEVDVFGGKVEVWNDSGTFRDLSGYRLNGSTLDGVGGVAPGGFALVDVAGLSAGGSQLVLEDEAAVEIDAVSYGVQIPGASIARLGREGAWGLAKPSPGAANLAQPMALRSGLRLNEWLLSPECLFTHDFVEIYNSGSLPASLSGLTVDIEPMLAGDAWTATPLSFIGAGGFTAIIADGDLAMGANHADFDGGGFIGAEIRLLADSSLVDVVANNVEIPDVSGGRLRPGGAEFATFTLPTPGFAVTILDVETVTPLVSIDDIWSYEDSDTDLGTAWRSPLFDVSLWATGGGLLGRETSPDSLPEALLTEINYVQGIPTYYFRRAFDFEGDLAKASLRLRTVVDDGVVIYLNGSELFRRRMDDPVTHASFASDNVSNASYEGPFDLAVGGLEVGRNVVAAEVHQDDGNSSDIVFGLELEAVETEQVSEGLGDAQAIVDGLRLTEIMFAPSEGGVEYLELRNTGPDPFDLGGLRFTEGVEFVFPPLLLGPGEFVYVVADAGAFPRPDLRVAGEFAGSLDDGGERLRLELGFGAGVVDVTYRDWAAEGAAGGGNSLELVAGGGIKGGRWVAGTVVGGSLGYLPDYESYGEWRSGIFTPVELVDELISGPQGDPDQDGLVNFLERLLGGDPRVPDAGIPEISVVAGEVVLRYPRAAGVGDASLEVTMSADLTAWIPVAGLSAEVVSATGDGQMIEARIPLGVIGRRFLRIEGVQE